ncbi:hypothetical protein WJX73_007779 [Symbiochloris irregularis]|uniref:Uncharacterized protein n=1 Tax=Symbiochloris irregularis TaxID=706552 RepID=A0AAW1NVS3_9CHLO
MHVCVDEAGLLIGVSGTSWMYRTGSGTSYWDPALALQHTQQQLKLEAWRRSGRSWDRNRKLLLDPPPPRAYQLAGARSQS